MSRDLLKGRNRLAPAIIVTVVVLGAVTAGFMWWLQQRHAATQLAEAREWAVSGPPCPVLDKAAFEAQPFPAAQQFQIFDMTFWRSSSLASCAAVLDNAGKGPGLVPTCQFSAPRLVRVQTAKGDYYFAPGLGHAATVTVRGGVPSCVLGSSIKFD